MTSSYIFLTINLRIDIALFSQYSLKHVDVYIDWQEQHSHGELPAIDLSDGDYELGLTDFETYTIINVNSSNNKFHFDKDDKEIWKFPKKYTNCMA